VRDDAGEQGTGQHAEDNELGARASRQGVDQHVDADVDAGPDAVGGAELGHPDEHDDAQFLRPGQVDLEQPVLDARNRQTGRVAVHHRDKNDQRRGADEEGDDPFLDVVEYFHGRLPSGRREASATG
jgi:hypothetical protein